MPQANFVLICTDDMPADMMWRAAPHRIPRAA
jgi:hypothetical protein